MHHIVLKDIGGEGQRKLLASKVLIIGAGGLGSPSALYLAAAGIGTIGIADDDKVELSNLQRQILHTTSGIGSKKTDSANKTLTSINPDVRVTAYPHRINEENIDSIIAEYDFIIDGSDNFETKYLINDACVKNEKPFSHGGVVAFRGQTFTYTPGSFCYRCIFPEPPSAEFIQNCRGDGILGTVAGIVGTIQATEAIKFLLGKGSLLTDRLLTIDAMAMEFQNIEFSRNHDCSVCGDKISSTNAGGY